MRGIRKLKSGKYQARYFAGYDSKGKRIDQSDTFIKQADAIKWRTKQLHEKEIGLSAESLGMTVEAHMAHWLEAVKQRTRPNTRKTYQDVVRLYINPGLGNLRLRSLQPLHVERWQSELLSRISPRSVRDVRTVLSMSLTWAVKLALVNSNPVKPTYAPKVERNEMKTFTAAQADTFLLACSDDKWGLFYTIMLNTGMRPEEVQGLKWSAVNLDEARLKVEKVLMTRGVEHWELYPPKTRYSRRTIAFPVSLVPRLNEHRKRQLVERMAAGGAYDNNEFVFANPIGEPLTRSPLQRHFKAVLKRAELPDMRLYDLRHSFVTLSLLAKIDLKTVSSDAGHASVAFTLDHYGHVLESMRESAANAREEMFGKANARGGK